MKHLDSKTFMKPENERYFEVKRNDSFKTKYYEVSFDMILSTITSDFLLFIMYYI